MNALSFVILPLLAILLIVYAVVFSLILFRSPASEPGRAPGRPTPDRRAPRPTMANSRPKRRR